MTASRLDGKLCAAAVEESLQSDILTVRKTVEPHLAVVIVGTTLLAMCMLTIK